MIYELVNDCIELETERGIAKTTIKELSRYLHEFANYCQLKSITVEQISSDNVAAQPIARISVRDSAKDAVAQCGPKAKQEGLCHSRSYLQHRYAAVFSGGIKKRSFFRL